MNKVLQRCFREQILCEIIYLSDNGEITKRCITIKSFTSDTVKAYCHLRKKIRNFKVENILSAFPILGNGELFRTTDNSIENIF
ncbi:hypothetical protein [Bacillus solimangrovi]|uniref:WYL domain-containing protein n=1 Tax=Bacillus solimangrovi TaxID=1305675 RepID=A0A1E5LJ75_9BACI|nr:hypothetical protein [Bacillus solimangrovi]OEH94078.1 hypothetical protein BFG57_09530 [Bacillus solimangrovi]